MNSSMNSRREFLIRQECERLLVALDTTGQAQRAVAAVAKRLLLNAPYYYNGRSLNPKVKSLGVGVYEITI